MPTTPRREERPVQRPAAAPRKSPKEGPADETLREQSKTETEERPYLDTEGGE
jgi:hypothetical protein